MPDNEQVRLIEDAIREAGPTSDNAPESAMLVSWVVVSEWAVPADDEFSRRWIEYSDPQGQGYSTTVGLVRVAERMLHE